MTFKNWLENNHKLDGEYWITNDGSTMYADGNVGDYNHEAYVIEYVQAEIASSFNVDVEIQFTDWDKVKDLIIILCINIRKIIIMHELFIIIKMSK